MPSLVGPYPDMNSLDVERGHPRSNGINGGFDYQRDDFGREDMRREDDDRYRRGVRNGGPAFDSSRFNTDYLDQTSLSDFRSNEPKFELDHLATFAAGSRSGVIHAEDGLRKLRQMENTTGIWTMRCMLIVERGNLVILDYSTVEELERFPIQQVQDPTAIFKNDRREIYNNLILFTIVDDAKRRGSSADMHIFQSCKSPAQEIVDEILAAKSGQQRIYPPGGGSRIPPPPVGPAPEPPYDLQAMSFGENRQLLGQQRSFITRVGDLREKEDYTGGSTEILERDVQLLNHCFDDIEKFVARLQQAAESYKELEKRKRDRGAKNKKPQSGDGMLNARARPPPDRDFVDIFQKFKLSFNLLAKLKAHIHDPNAPELVHFLFTPLSLIYEASRDPFHGNQNLGDQAVAPVLTADAKQLLNNCLTTKEVELWQALGKHWTTSRDEWSGTIPPYVPEFYDGWQPAAPVIDDVTARSMLSQPLDDRPPVRDYGPPAQLQRMPFPDEDRHPFHNNIVEHNNHHDRFDPVHAPGPSGLPSSHMDCPSPRPASPFLPDLEEPSRGRTHAIVEPKPPAPQIDENTAYFDELRRSGTALIYEAAHERIGKNEKELTVQKGDILQVLENSRNWWKLRNHKGEVGFAPYTILKPVKTDFEYHNDRGLTNGGGAPMSYRSDNYLDDNSSRRGVSRRGSSITSESNVFYEGTQGEEARSNLVKVTVKPKPKKPPRRGSEPSSQTNEASSELLTTFGHSGQRVPVPPQSRPPLPRSRAFSLQPEPLAGHDGEVSIIGPITLPDTEYSKLHPNQRQAPRRLTHPSITDATKVDQKMMGDLASKVALRNQTKSTSSAPNRSSVHEPALDSPRGRRSWNSPRLSRGDDVTHINERSTAGEVTEWLRNKNFSDRAIQVFRGQTGLDMFDLRLSDFQQLLGHDEATRLDGLLTLQKNSSGYGTRTAKELNAILQRRKQHVSETERNQTEEQIIDLIEQQFQLEPEPQQQQQQQLQQQAQLDQKEKQQLYARPSKGPDFRADQSGASFQQQLIRQRSQLRQSQGELDIVF